MSFKFLVLFLCLCSSGMGRMQFSEFRFDYKYSEAADGWLKLHRVPATWSDAKHLCHAEGAVLASPLTYKLRDAIIEHVYGEHCTYTIYTGVSTTHAKGSYASIEGKPLARLAINWAPGEPNNVNNAESCLAMHTARNGTVADVDCNNVLPFVCYKQKTKNLEIDSCGTTDIGYVQDPRTLNCYKFHRDGLLWDQAYRTCIAEGGYLMILNSDLESEVLNDLFKINPSDTIFAQFSQYAHIGHYYAKDGGWWMTIHGQTPREAGFSRWQPGEPNNGSQPLGEFCGCSQRDYPYLHDAPCNWVLPFICEMTPGSLLFTTV